MQRIRSLVLGFWLLGMVGSRADAQAATPDPVPPMPALVDAATTPAAVDATTPPAAVATATPPAAVASPSAPDAQPSIGDSLGTPAGKAPDSFWVGGSVVLRNPINLTTNKYPGVGLSYSLNLSFRFTDRIMGCIDLSAATPIASFNPNPSIGVGPAFLVARRFVINPELLYSASFPYPGVKPHETAHSIGGSVAFAFLRPPVIFAPVIILSRNLTQDQTLFVFGLKLGFMLFAL